MRRHPIRFRAAAATWLFTLWLAACSDAVAPVTFEAPVDLTLEWRAARPSATGIDEGALSRAAAMAEGIPRMRSLLVVHRGHLVLERYYGGTAAGDLADVRSVTKSIVSTLAGLARDRGHLAGLDRTLGELLPEAIGALDPWERDIKVRDLLTMSGGWAWTELGAIGYNDWILSGDPIGFLLAKPRAAAPGSTFAYNSASTHLLGVVLEEATGQSLPTFADEVLFGRIGIAARAWEPLGERVNGGAGLDLRPRDLARLGQLFLQDGWSGDDRVLPDGWVGEATQRRYSWLNDAGPTRLAYGYLWWTDEDNDAYLAWGYGGQFVYVAPSRDLVVVTTTEWRQVDGQSAPSDLSSQVLRVIVDGVLPSVPRR